jgi:signal transduction histidine kinase/DNA-binding response OmpR family regulator
MKGFFRRLTLPAKLIFIGTLPLLFLLVIAFQYNKEKSDKLELLDSYRERIQQATLITDLIDHLQSERRYSFGYQLNGAWQNEMVQQRTKTDEVIALLERDAATTLPGFTTYTFLSGLKDFRGKIDKGMLKPLEVINFFTNAIFRLNTLTSVAAGTNHVYLQPVIQTLAGQKILSDISTYKGMVVAQLFYMLHDKESSSQLVSSIIQLQDIINSLSREFSLKAPPHRVQQVEALKGDFDVKEATRIKDRIRAANAIDTSIAADFWWSVATKEVDKFKAVQREMMEESRKGADAIYEKEKQTQIWAIVILVLVLLIVVGFIVLAIRIITHTLSELREAAEMLARGETGIELDPETDDAIGSLTKSILAIDKNNHQLAYAAKSIGEGKFDVEVYPRSQEDILGNAVLHMKEDLQQFRKGNAEKLWVQEGVARINDSLRGDKKIEAIAHDTLDALVGYLEAESGLFYSAHYRQLRFEAGYAVSDKESVPKELEFGETLIGQAALKNDVLHLQNVPDEFLKIRSGLGTAQPGTVLIVPLCVDDRVEGVIEIASFKEISGYRIQFVREVANDIAIALQAAKSKERLQELFEQTQSQAEELQSQHSELENINAELEAQAEKLKASEEELKVQQEELLQANQELEERSRLLEERNQLIVEKNLEIQGKAEELALSTKYKSEFLANMSHELRTPLNSVLLLSRLLSENNEKNLSKEQVEYATVIQSSGQGLLSLIDEILDLSKIEAGKMELEYQPIMVQEIVNDMKALFAPIAKEKGLELAVTMDENLPSRVETDKMRLEQVLRNLLSNALKFTSSGSVSLAIETLKENDSFLSFTVKDTGIGIAKEKLGLIFEAFQQADGSTRRKYGGTGLGLSISRELIRLLGGEIKVDSEPGKGSVFTIYLPINQAVASQVTAPAPASTAELPPLEEGQPSTRQNEARQGFRINKIPESLPDDRQQVQASDKTILIIEDDTAFAKALLNFTHQKGYKGLVAVRGDEGIALARQYKPVGILLDLQLPVKDGWEVMEELKSDPATRHIPVHIMSSLEAKRESLVKGAVDFINKPVAFEQMQEVFKKLEQVISKQHKKVLIVEENPKHAKALAYFLETFQVATEISTSVHNGIDALKKQEVDCVILDMGIPDQQAYETLEEVKKSPGMEHLPIIIFTGKNLSKKEESRIKQYADSIVIKTAHSYQRILDEVSLFLHLVEETNGEEKGTNRYRRLGALNEVLANKKVLVVDDDVRNIFSLTKALELHNMQAITAVDGKEALKQLQEHPDTSIVLMDIMMPEMDGYEAMQQIRKKPAFRHLPIIAVTAKAMTGDREKCIKAGASDYISKPVDIDQLLSLLRVWLYDKSI